MTLASPKKLSIAIAVLLMGLSWLVSPVHAQNQLNRGFEYRITSYVLGEEIARQPGLWMMNIEYKTLRMINVDVTDPVTGEKKPTRIVYLVYRAWRPQIETKQRENVPVNDLDAPRGPKMFMPEFTLVTTDNDRQDVYVDQIIPEAQAAIIKRERQQLFNSVQLIQPVPEATPQGERPENMIYGVAMWPNVDPEADRFTVYMTGFSNAYVAAPGPDGETLMLRKTVRQRYWRPGDELETFEKEFRTEGPSDWIYRAADGSFEQAAKPAEEAGDGETDSADGADADADDAAQ